MVQLDCVQYKQQIMTYIQFSQKFANALAEVGQTPLKELKPPKKTGDSIKNSQSQSFEPQYHQIKKLGLSIKKNKLTTGSWNYYENRVYLNFMIKNSKDFQTEKLRRKNKVFYRLSKILKRRTPNQCRSHHQKLQLKFNDNLKAIISQVQKKIKKCMTEEYLNQQDQFFNMKFPINNIEIKQHIEQDKQQKIINGQWYDIEVKKSSWIVTIDQSEIKCW